MAVAPTQGYQPQISPGATAPQPGASPSAYGAEIGAGMVSLGGELLDKDLQVRRLQLERWRQQDAAQAGADFAALQGSARTQIDDLQHHAAPGAAGHVTAVTGVLAQPFDQFLAGIPNEQIRSAYAERVAEFRGTTLASETGWANGRGVLHQRANFETANNIYRNQLQTNPNLHEFWGRVADTRTQVHESIPDADLASEVEHELVSGLGGGLMDGTIEQDPHAALEMLHGHSFDDILTPAQMAHFTDAAQTEIRVREADQRRALETARTTARTQAQRIEQRFNENDPTLTAAEVAQAETAATAAGLEPEAHNAHRWGVQLQAQQEFRNAGPDEISAEVGRLDERIAHAGANASPDDQIRRDYLAGQQSRRATEVQNDPLAAYQHAGGHVSPLDFADPASVNSRVTAARSAQRQYHFLNVFTQPEVAQMRELVASGPQGRLQAINDIGAINNADPDVALRAAEQIAPGDHAFRYAIRADPAVREMIVSGADARRSLGRVVREDGSGSTVDAETEAWFNANAGPALVHYPAGFGQDLLEASRNIYAEKRRQAGVLGNETFDRGGFLDSVNVALGGFSGRGGLGTYNGATIVLPRNINQNEFNLRMAFLPTGDPQQHPRQRGWINGEPVWSDGHPIGRSELRSQFVPVAVGDGLYQFRRGNELAMTRQGRPLQIDIRLVAPGNFSGAGVATGHMLTDRRDPESVRHPDTAHAFYGAPPRPAGN